jgi:hypothetical protein
VRVIWLLGPSPCLPLSDAELCRWLQSFAFPGRGRGIGPVRLGLDTGESIRDTCGVATDPPALTYSRSIYASIMDWYSVADTKGQLLLTLNGIYITVLSSIVIISPKDLANRKASLTPVTWLFLGGAAAATIVSILSAIACLRSRLSNSKLDKDTRDLLVKTNSTGRDTYRPAVTFWFGTIARMDERIGTKMLQSADEAFELEALIEEIFLLARYVLTKHRWVNRGWIAAGASLLLLLTGAITVIIST